VIKALRRLSHVFMNEGETGQEAMRRVREIAAAALAAESAAWELPDWSKRDDLGGKVPSEIRQALGDAYRAGQASATGKEKE
jgi:hypothetical protein